jgi:hypothetical protein
VKKFLFYITFVALAMYCAEIISYNDPNILFEPTAYIGYGILYVFFIHSLITRKVTKWSTVYFYGMLVGIITEAFLPKVLFFGWDSSSFTFIGIAWIELFILTFFYHPFFSFIVPVFIARKWLNYPFALETKGLTLKIILPVAIVTLFSVGNAYIEGGGQFPQTLISTIILVTLIILLKRSGQISDIGLTVTTRKYLFGLAFLLYGFVFIVGDVPYGGRLPELGAFIFILIYIASVSILIYRELPEKYDIKNVQEIQIKTDEVNYKRNIYVEEIIGYIPDLNNIKVVLGAIAFISLVIVGSLLPLIIAPAIPVVLIVILLAGMIFGCIYFLRCLFRPKVYF